MATVFLPLRSDAPHFTFTTTLETVAYGFEFWWNERIPGWMMSINTEDGTPILSGLRVVIGFPLTGRFNDPRLPPGLFMAQDTAGGQEDPGLTDLGNRVQLAYIESTDLAAL